MSQTDATLTEPIPTPPNFPVDWADPMEARLFWVQDRMHYPGAVGPMAESFEFRSLNTGAPRAFERASVPIRPVMRVINGYVYMGMKPISFDPAVLAEAGQKAEKSLQAAMMGLERTWQEEVLPEILSDIAALHTFDYTSATDTQVAAHLDWLEGRRARHWDLHFQVMLPALPALVLFEKLYRQLMPGADEMEPHVLL